MTSSEICSSYLIDESGFLRYSNLIPACQFHITYPRLTFQLSLVICVSETDDIIAGRCISVLAPIETKIDAVLFRCLYEIEA